MARGKRYRTNQQATPRKIEVGRRVDGYRIERIVIERPGVHLLADARVPGGDRVLLDFVAGPLSEDRELRRRMARLIPRRSGLNHPNVLTLRKSVEGGQRLHLEALPRDAVTLAERLRAGRLEQEMALAIAGQIAGALDSGRDKGLVHRALSPRAVFLASADEPRVLLTDFGICAPRGPACELRGAVDEAAYRSPEEIRGEAPEPASNVYSLACILFECLTGATPFTQSRPLLTLHAKLTEPAPLASERDPALPGELDSVLAAALDRDPRRRQPSAETFVEAAAKALGLDVDVPVVRAPKPEPTPTPAPTPKPIHTPAPVRPHQGQPPKRTRSEQAKERTPRARRLRPGHRRMAPLLGGLALLASAAAGFASGNATWNEPSPSQQATTVVSAGPTPAPQNVDVAVERLDSRRIASRRELRAAKRPQGQARAARRLARAYEDARARVAKNGIEGPSEARLAHRLKAVEAAYRDLAKAAQSGDRARWKAARKATSTRESGLELLLRNREWN